MSTSYHPPFRPGDSVEVEYLDARRGGVGSATGRLGYVLGPDDAPTELAVDHDGSVTFIDLASVIAVHPGPSESDLRAHYGDR